jgi:hypothetical protein
LIQDFSGAIRPKGKNTLVDIAVTPNADSTGIKGFDSWRERIMVGTKERPLQNRANREIVDFFSKLFNADVKIISGAKSRQKTLEVSIPAEEARRMLYESE